jgi:hypothetical protein
MSNTNQMETANGVTSSNEPNPYSNHTLIDEINEMRASNSTNTPEFVAKMRELEILLGVSQISPFGTKEFSASTRNSRRNIMPTSMNSFVMDPNNPEHKHLMKIINDI